MERKASTASQHAPSSPRPSVAPLSPQEIQRKLGSPPPPAAAIPLSTSSSSTTSSGGLGAAPSLSRRTSSNTGRNAGTTSSTDEEADYSSSSGIRKSSNASTGMGGSGGQGLMAAISESGSDSEEESDAQEQSQSPQGGRGLVGRAVEKLRNEASPSGGASGGEERYEVAVKSGYLMKKGERRKAWKKRWFVLRGGRLAMYKNDKEYLLLRLIPLTDLHSIAPVTLKKHLNTFAIVTPKRTYYIKASSSTEMNDWCSTLDRAKKEVGMLGTVTSGDQTPAAYSPGGGDLTPTAGPGGNGAGRGGVEEVTRGVQRTSFLGSSPNLSPQDHQTPTFSSYTPSPGITSTSTFSQPLQTLPPPLSPTSQLKTPDLSTTLLMSGTSSSPSNSYFSPRLEIPSSSAGSGPPVGLGLIPPSSPGVLSSSEEEGDEFDYPQTPKVPYPTNLPSSSTSTSTSNPQQQQQQGIRFTPQSLNSETTSATTTKGLGTVDPNKVILSGYLMKQSSKTRRGGWRKRWFVLMSGKLCYYRSHMDNRPPRQIPLSQILDALEAPSSPPSSSHPSSLPSSSSNSFQSELQAEHTFKIITPKRTYIVCAPSEEDEIKWLAALQVCLGMKAKQSGSGQPPSQPSQSTSNSIPGPPPTQRSNTNQAVPPTPVPTPANTSTSTSNNSSTASPKVSRTRERSVTDAAKEAVREGVESYRLGRRRESGIGSNS